MTDLIESVKRFTEAVGCTTDRYNARQTALYIGLQLEEMAEKLEALGGCEMRFTVEHLKEKSHLFKAGKMDNAVAEAYREDLLDADIDLAWVTLGSAFSQGADVAGAAGEVARSNMSKLVECGCDNGRVTMSDGIGRKVCDSCNGLGLVAIKDENGKVKKPQTFSPPNLEPFICKD